MDAKFYLKNLINSSKQNSGEGNQNQEGNQTETDPIKKYLNELAIEKIKKGVYYTDVINIESGEVTLLNKAIYTTIMQPALSNISTENKIGDENNYDFVIIKYPDGIDPVGADQTILYQNSKFIFVDEENASYFLNKFIRVSTKQFMKSILYSMNFQDTNELFSDLDVNAKNFEEKIAINTLKFGIVIGFGQYTQSIVIDDVDLQTFYLLKRTGENQLRCIFDENEDKIMFKDTIDTGGETDECNFITFIFRNNGSNSVITTNINGINYKYINPQSA